MNDKMKLTPQEALYIACQMEKRAISLYERASLVFSALGFKEILRDLLLDEQAHLTGFTALMQGGEEIGGERALLLDQLAGGVLFEGGLSGAVREGAFDSAASLLRYAADEEEAAAERYQAFAKISSGQTAATFKRVALSELSHLRKLLDRLDQLTQEGK